MEIGEGGAKEKLGRMGGWGGGVVTIRQKEKTKRKPRKRGEWGEEEGGIQIARRQKNCGENAGVP